MARRLGLPNRGDQQEQISDLLQELARRERWLLIFDNAENPQDFIGYQLSGGRGHIIITSRNPVWGEVAKRLGVGVFNRHEARTFLLNRSGGNDRAAAESLAEEMGELPLALEQAAAYMEQAGLSLSEYLELYRHNRDELLSRGQTITYGATVDATFRLAVGRVAQQSSAALQLLQVCAFLAPEAIPHDLIRGKPRVLPKELAAAVQNEATYTEIVGIVNKYSLLQREQDGIRLHRLVQAIVRQSLAPEDRALRAAQAETLVREVWEDRPRGLDDWSKGNQLLPHALTAAEYVRSLHPTTCLPGWLLNNVALFLGSRQDLPAAKAYFQRAIAIFEAVHGSRHRDTAVARDYLGRVLMDMHDFDSARTQIERALEIFEHVPTGHQQDDLAVAHTNLSICLLRLDEPASARAAIERALTIYKTKYGPNSTKEVSALLQFGDSLLRTGDLTGSRTYLERALSITDSIKEPDSEIPHALQHFGSYLLKSGDSEGAQRYTERAIAIWETMYGPEHTSLLYPLDILARALEGSGDLAGARQRLERALAIEETAFGLESPRLKTTLLSLGSILDRLGDPAEARKYRERASTIEVAARPLDESGL